METYLLDTSALSPLVDSSHPKHGLATTLIANLSSTPMYVSVLALAELAFGLELHEKAHGTKVPNAEQMLSDALNYPRLWVEHHTAAEYASLRATVAVFYLPNVTKQFRKKWVEDWVDRYTCKKLGVDDNDLWICAQALEMNFTLIADDKMNRIGKAEPKLKLLPIQP